MTKSDSRAEEGAIRGVARSATIAATLSTNRGYVGGKVSVARLQSDRADIWGQWQSNGRQCAREIMHDERAAFRSNHELSITANILESNRYSIEWVKFLSSLSIVLFFL